jgi:Mrp family chromosome partitioning ATPase/capsular polysaccharide biosynthesis protein
MKVTFEQLFRVLKKRWGLVVICFVFASLGAFLGSSKLMKPVYQSTALVEVSVNFGGSSLINDNIIASQQLAGTEAQLATTYPVLSVVASHHPGFTVDSLTKEVAATARPNTQLLEIDVTDPDPKLAASIANDVAATLIKQQNAIAAQQIATPTPQQGVTPPVQQAGFLVIAQSARPPTMPSQTSKIIYTVGGLVVGLLLGVLLAIILELLDTRVGTEEALTQLLGWPILGTIWQAGNGEDVINPIDQDSNVESYSILRTNVGFAAIDKPLQTLVVTSGKPGEGRTVVATNLAIFMARAGKNTLLIDANLRQPALHEQFGIPAHAMGFSNAVLMFNRLTTVNPLFTSKTGSEESAVAAAGEASLGPFVRVGDIPNLYVMPSGPLPPNPPELLDSKAMQGFFAALKSCGAEVVIFDTPPLLGLSDASILASKVDGTLVVVDINHASKGNLKQMKALLEQAKVRVIGCVVNKQRRSRKDTTKSYGYRAEKHSKRGSRSQQSTNYPAAPLVTSGVVSTQSTPPPPRVEPMVSKQSTPLPQPTRIEPMVSKQSTPLPQPTRVEPMISRQSTPLPQPTRVEPMVSKQSTPLPQPTRVEPMVSKQSTPSSEPVRTEPMVSKQSTPLPQPTRVEPMVSKQSTPSSEPVRTEPMVSKQSTPLPQPTRVEPMVSKQSTSLSQPTRIEPTVSKQSTPSSEPVRTEPTVSKQSTPLPQPDQDGQNNARNHEINNGKSSPAVSIGATLVEVDRDQTMPLNGGKIGDLREDG